MKYIEDYNMRGNRYDISPLTKTIRSEYIKKHMAENNIKRAVCFSSGYALRVLREAGVDVVGVSENGGDFAPCRWFTKQEIADIFPTCFDATSGHLPLKMLKEIAGEIASILKVPHIEQCRILSGSGESAVLLKLAFPELDVIPLFDPRFPCTRWDKECEFNFVLKRFFKKFEIVAMDGNISPLLIT